MVSAINSVLTIGRAYLLALPPIDEQLRLMQELLDRRRNPIVTSLEAGSGAKQEGATPAEQEASSQT